LYNVCVRVCMRACACVCVYVRVCVRVYYWLQKDAHSKLLHTLVSTTS